MALAVSICAAAATLTAASSAAAASDAAMRAALSQAVARAKGAETATLQGPTRPMARPAPAGGLRAVTASSVFYDAVGDTFLAPDLQQMIPFTNDDGRYTVVIVLGTNALVDGDAVVTFVNTDGNAFTGNPSLGGADLAVAIIGQIGPDAVETDRWNGVGWEPAYFPSLISFPSGGTDEVWSIAASELGIAPGTPTSLVFGSIYSGIYDDDYFDFAPEPGLAPFAFTAGALSAPPPPPPPPPPAPVAPPVVPAGGPSPDAARPFALRGFGLRATAGTLRARIAWVGGTGRVTWQVRLRSRVNGREVTRLVRGAGAAGNRSFTRSIAIPPSWRGATASVRLVVTNGSRTVVRTRSVRL